LDPTGTLGKDSREVVPSPEVAGVIRSPCGGAAEYVGCATYSSGTVGILAWLNSSGEGAPSNLLYVGVSRCGDNGFDIGGDVGEAFAKSMSRDLRPSSAIVVMNCSAQADPVSRELGRAALSGSVKVLGSQGVFRQ
jgi:hypothetical protein